MAAAKEAPTQRGSAHTEQGTAGVLHVKEEEVRGLSVPRLRLLIYLLKGEVPMKPGNISYAERATRILTAGTAPFFMAQWDLVKGLPPAARNDPVLFKQFKESADEAIRVEASPLKAHFVPTPAPAVSEMGSVEEEDD